MVWGSQPWTQATPSCPEGSALTTLATSSLPVCAWEAMEFSYLLSALSSQPYPPFLILVTEPSISPAHLDASVPCTLAHWTGCWMPWCSIFHPSFSTCMASDSGHTCIPHRLPWHSTWPEGPFGTSCPSSHQQSQELAYAKTLLS